MNPLTLTCAFVSANLVIGIAIAVFWHRAHTKSLQAADEVQEMLKSVLEWTREAGPELGSFLEHPNADGRPLIDYADPQQNANLPSLTWLNEEAQEAARKLLEVCESFGEINTVLEAVVRKMQKSTEAVVETQPGEGNPAPSSTENSWTAFQKDKRLNSRRPMLFQVDAFPLDSNHAATGEPFEALARELSSGGMSISHTVPNEAPFLGLHLQPSNEEPIFVIMRVQHRSSVGGVFISGGSFVRRVDAEFIESLRAVPT